MIQKYKKDFEVKVGISDHSLGSTLPVLSVGLGAKVIEKHFILEKSIGGPDSSFSLDEKEFTQMVESIREAESAIGKIDYNLTEKQIQGKSFSRSLYLVKDVNKGDIATKLNVRSIRPGFGMHPKELNNILKKKFNKSYKLGDRITEEMFN